jgi:hypothetical protein
MPDDTLSSLNMVLICRQVFGQHTQQPRWGHVPTSYEQKAIATPGTTLAYSGMMPAYSPGKPRCA